jgi:hypothetical protein
MIYLGAVTGDFPFFRSGEKMSGQTKPAADPKRDGNGQTSKTVILTSLITAITTIAVSFIAIVPQCRKSDTESILKLNQEINTLKEVKNPTIGSFELKGRILNEKNEPVGKAEIYLIPATGSEHMAISDDTGNFIFNHLDSGSHWIVVRDPTSRSSRGLIEQGKPIGKVPLIGATVDYNLLKE